MGEGFWILNIFIENIKRYQLSYKTFDYLFFIENNILFYHTKR